MTKHHARNIDCSTLQHVGVYSNTMWPNKIRYNAIHLITSYQNCNAIENNTIHYTELCYQKSGHDAECITLHDLPLHCIAKVNRRHMVLHCIAMCYIALHRVTSPSHRSRSNASMFITLTHRVMLQDSTIWYRSILQSWLQRIALHCRKSHDRICCDTLRQKTSR